MSKTEKNKKVSVLISNTNTRDVLDLCLQNLKDIYSNLEVIVIDNNSIDGSADMIAESHPWVKLIRTQNNGLATGLNLGLKQATGDYYLYLGTDGFPEKGTTIEGLIDYFEKNPNVGAATVKLLTRDGQMDMDCHRALPTPWVSLTHFLGLDKLFPTSKLFAQYFMTHKDLDSVHEIGMTITHFLFVRKETHEKVGLWDEQFFVYGEDVDMCYRIQQAGYKLMYLGNLKAGHWKGVILGRKETKERITTQGNISVRGKEMSRTDFYLFMRKCQSDAMRVFYKKHLGKKYPLPVTMAVLTSVTLQEKYRIYSWKFMLWKKARAEKKAAAKTKKS